MEAALPATALLPHTLFLLLLFALLPLAVYLFHTLAYATDIPHIHGIPSPPDRAAPFHGHLRALGPDHPTRLQRWAVDNGWPVLQVALGRRRVVVLNTVAAAQHFLQRNAGATVDRPVLSGGMFHGVVSGTQGMI